MAALGVLNPIAWIAQRRPLEKAIGRLSTIPVYHFQKESKNSFCIKANTMSKLFLISHLLLAERKVRVAAGDAPNSFGKMGGNQWAALCAAPSAVGSKPLSSILVCLYNRARTYFSKNC